MMKMDSKPMVKGSQKAQHLAVLAFFLCTLSARPADNEVTGNVYGNDFLVATASSIFSVQDGRSALLISYAGTTNLSLDHTINGLIAITNNFDSFTIHSTSNATVTAVDAVPLRILGGNNLTIAGGYFAVTNGVPNGGGPPSLPTPENNTGVVITDTQKTLIDGTTILAGSDSGTGGPALELNNGSLIITGNAYLKGGDDSSALQASTADVQITNGIFIAGNGGNTLLLEDNSTANIYGGTFSTDPDAYTFKLHNSSLYLHDGVITNGSLFSQADSGSTNHVALHAGRFDSLLFQGTSNSTQRFTAGSGLIVDNGLFQDGGNLVVSNLVADALPTVRLSNGASLQFLQNFTLPDQGVFWIDSATEQAGFSTLRLESGSLLNLNTGRITAEYFESKGSSTNQLVLTDHAHGRIDTQTAYFHSGSALIIDASSIGISSSETNEYVLVTSDTGQLFAGADTNTAATAETFKDHIDIDTSASGRTRFIDLYFDTLNGDTLVTFQFTAKGLSEYWGLTNGNESAVTAEFADELESLASSEMLAVIDSFESSEASLTATELAYFTTMNTFQTSMQGLQASVGQSVSRGAEFREQLQLLPPGAKGPERNNELRGWAKYYGQFYNHDAAGLNAEYDATLHGGVVGVDKNFGNLLLGVCGGAGNYSTTAGTDAEEDIRAYQGALYGTMGSERTYIDTGIAYGLNNVETRTGGPFMLNGEFDARILSAYIGGGYDLVDTEGGTVFTPEASIQYSMYEQDAYTESSTISVPRTIDAFDADSLRSSLGLNVSMLNTTALNTFGFKLDGRFHWLHEFNPDPGNMTFRLEGGSNDYQLAHPLLDEELFRAGIGCSFFNTMDQQPKNVLLRLDFDELFGDGFNSHNLSAKVIYAF